MAASRFREGSPVLLTLHQESSLRSDENFPLRDRALSADRVDDNTVLASMSRKFLLIGVFTLREMDVDI